MIDGTYKIWVEVFFSRKEGEVVLRTEGDVMYADINAPVVGKQYTEGKVEGNTFTAEGTGKFLLVGKVEYKLKGEVSGDDLHIVITSNKGEVALDGVRVSRA